MFKHFLLIFFITGLLPKAKGQIIEHVNLPEPKGDRNCVYRPKYSPTQRDQFYPFNIADTIKLVSFRYHLENYPIKADSIINDSLIEIRTLTKSEIAKLTDLIYNNFYKSRPNYGSINCFYPRNAILFLDSSGRLKEHILICFHCKSYRESSDKIKLGDDCTRKMEKLRLFFFSLGLKFGTDKAVESYPGETFKDESVPWPIDNSN